VNHYEILGLNSSAGILEIKASFRHLAKIYHPDKNPDGIEHFTKILKAYETLSDPRLKATYDYKLQYQQSQYQKENKQKTATKNWKFDERELKRRQYYNDHIKKYAKQTSEFMAEAEKKKNYNEFKYILFATPLAVLLFLLIMHFATRDREEVIRKVFPITKPIKKTPKVEAALPDPKPSNVNYNSVFGTPKYDTLHNKTLTIKNLGDKDIIVCLFSKKEFLRSFYLKENVAAEVSQLPAGKLFMRYFSGRDFDTSCYLDSSGIYGAFTKDRTFYKSIDGKTLASLNELTLLSGIHEGFKRISEKEFFKK
jgi:hypothetical protein